MDHLFQSMDLVFELLKPIVGLIIAYIVIMTILIGPTGQFWFLYYLKYFDADPSRTELMRYCAIKKPHHGTRGSAAMTKTNFVAE